MAGPSQIFLTSAEGSTHVLRDLHKLRDLQAAAARVHACDASELVLSVGTRLLPDTPELALAEAGIEDNSTVFASARLLGGGKKRKKKTYTKPKKIKHKHKTVKLAVLKYYKIGPDGEVERLRKECPAAMCGAGVFLGAHANRVNCGKCGLTFVEQS